MTLRRVPVARLIGVFGLRGEMKARVTPAGAQALVTGKTYALDPEGGGEHVTLSAVRQHHERTIVAIAGIETPEAARSVIGRDLYAERSAIVLAPGEYLDDDLIGFTLVDEAGNELARVIGVEHYPAQDCLVVEPGRALVPLVREFVLAIDMRTERIVTALPPGLLNSQLAEIDADMPPQRARRGRRAPK